jgi:hypothetical protein
MTNKAKIKGSRWEYDAVNILNERMKGSCWKRVPGSGAIGTTMGETLLTGDIIGDTSLPRNFRGECKVGYGNKTDSDAKSFTLKKAWLDKIAMEARNSYRFPVLLCKFDGVHSGVKQFAVLDIDDFVEIVNLYSELKKELEVRDESMGRT